jgi:hypothetical protein
MRLLFLVRGSAYTAVLPPRSRDTSICNTHKLDSTHTLETDTPQRILAGQPYHDRPLLLCAGEGRAQAQAAQGRTGTQGRGRGRGNRRVGCWVLISMRGEGHEDCQCRCRWDRQVKGPGPGRCAQQPARQCVCSHCCCQCLYYCAAGACTTAVTCATMERVVRGLQWMCEKCNGYLSRWASGRGTARTWKCTISTAANSCTIVADVVVAVANGSGVRKGCNSGG